MRRANKAKNDMFIAFTRMGVGPGVNIDSHSDVAIEAIVNASGERSIFKTYLHLPNK
jgi:hypothetical protein